MMITSTSVLVVEEPPKNYCCPCLCLEVELYFHPASPGDSPDQQVYLTQTPSK